MSNDRGIVELESDMTQISTNSIEAARKLSATVAGKSKKRISEQKSFEPGEYVKRQRIETIEKKRKNRRESEEDHEANRPRKRRAQPLAYEAQ